MLTGRCHPIILSQPGARYAVAPSSPGRGSSEGASSARAAPIVPADARDGEAADRVERGHTSAAPRLGTSAGPCTVECPLPAAARFPRRRVLEFENPMQPGPTAGRAEEPTSHSRACACQIVSSAVVHSPGSATLTERENEVLALLATGDSNRSISRNLSVSERTVKAHVTRIYDKLGVQSRVQAALVFVVSGWNTCQARHPDPQSSLADTPDVPPD